MITYLIIEISNRYKHTNYPVVISKGICEGMLRVLIQVSILRKCNLSITMTQVKCRWISEANIIEIVDHHNIGNISTSSQLILEICQ